MFPFLVNNAMADTTITQKENKTPILYDFFGDQYDFNDLSKRVYSGLDKYISTNKRSKKYETELREAVDNLMEGIKYGTITFENGRYNDSLGRYSNNENRKKDVYGWAAKYIYDNMMDSNKYTPKEDTSKKKWSDTSMSQAFIRDMFGAGGINYDYFVEQDQPDESGVRGTSIRTGLVADWLDNVNNDLFSHYTGLTDSEKANLIAAAQLASKKLRENGFDSGDYLYLSRILPGIEWNQLFRTTSEQKQTQNNQPREITQQGFNDYLKENWRRMPNSSSQLSLQNTSQYGQHTYNQLIQAIKGMDNQTLFDYLITAFNDKDRDFGAEPIFYKANGVSISSQWLISAILQRMAAQDKLIQDKNNPNIYYIPELIDWNTNSGYYYDESNNTLYKRSIQDIPY